MKTILPLLLSALLACSSAAADIKLAWDDAQPGVTYRLEIAPAATPNAWTVAKDNIPRRTVIVNDPLAADYQETTLTGLAPGTYLIRVFARAAGVDSLPSNVITEAIAPNAPGLLRKVRTSK